MFSIIPGMLCQQGVHDLLSRVKNHWQRQWQLVQHSPIWMNVWKMTFRWCKVQLHQCLLAQSATKNNIKHQVWGSKPETRGYIDPQFPQYLKSLHASKCQKCQNGLSEDKINISGIMKKTLNDLYSALRGSVAKWVRDLATGTHAEWIAGFVKVLFSIWRNIELIQVYIYSNLVIGNWYSSLSSLDFRCPSVILPPTDHELILLVLQDFLGFVAFVSLT